MHDNRQAEERIDWKHLRFMVALAHARRGADGERGIRCAYCLGIIHEWDKPRGALADGHMHEALVGRGHLAKSKHHLIMKDTNCVPLHPGCHEHTKDVKLRALAALMRNIGPSRVASWYIDLWQEHGMPVAPGLLRPPKLVPAHRVYAKYLKLGERLNDEGAFLPDVGTRIARKWRGEKGVSIDRKLWETGRRVVDNGYYLDYLCGVFRADVDEVIRLANKEVQ